ncbi:MAG: DsbA family protein [bacterium]
MVKVEVAVNPGTVNFRELLPDEKKSQTIEVTNMGNELLKVSSVTSPHDFVNIDLTGQKLPVSLKYNEKMSFKVGVDAALMKEKTWGQVMIGTNNSHTPEVTLHITGRVQQPRNTRNSEASLPQLVYSDQAQKLFPLYNFVLNNVAQNLAGCNTGQCLPMKAFIQLLVNQKVPEEKITETIRQIYGPGAVAASGRNVRQSRPSLLEAVQNELKSSQNAKLELFVMSYCPFAIRAEKAMEKVMAELGSKLDLQVYFIAQSKDAKADSKAPESGSASQLADSFSSLHGPQEVEEDFRQVLIQKYFPGKLLPYLNLRNQNIKTTDWKECATKAGIDLKKMEGLIAARENQQAFKENLTRAQVMNIHASPTLFINNVRYQGGFQ